MGTTINFAQYLVDLRDLLQRTTGLRLFVCIWGAIICFPSVVSYNNVQLHNVVVLLHLQQPVAMENVALAMQIPEDLRRNY